MKKTTAKALYLYLCSILGMVLFAMLHRAVFVLYDLLLVVDFDTYSFGMSSRTVLNLDFTTMLIALLIGGWYGIALGIEWYSMVYGPNAEKPAGMFHGFIPHTWRGKRMKRHKSTKHTLEEVAESSVKVPVSEGRSWSFEDLVAASASTTKKKTTTRKPTAKKVVRKTTKRVKTTVA